jgi:hypothetical protein
MKRHEVMDLFHGKETTPIGEWTKFDENYNSTLPVGKSCKVKVKLSDETETFVYYYDDKCSWIVYYGQKPSYFWDCVTKEPLFNVTHWKMLENVE